MVQRRMPSNSIQSGKPVLRIRRHITRRSHDTVTRSQSQADLERITSHANTPIAARTRALCRAAETGPEASAPTSAHTPSQQQQRRGHLFVHGALVEVVFAAFHAVQRGVDRVDRAATQTIRHEHTHRERTREALTRCAFCSLRIRRSASAPRLSPANNRV